MFQIFNDIVNMLGPYGKPDRCGFNPAFEQFLFVHNGMSRRGGVNYQRFYIRHIRQKREQPEFFGKPSGFFKAAFYLKGKD